MAALPGIVIENSTFSTLHGNTTTQTAGVSPLSGKSLPAERDGLADYEAEVTADYEDGDDPVAAEATPAGTVHTLEDDPGF